MAVRQQLPLFDPSLADDFVETYQAEKAFKLDNRIKSLHDVFMARIFKSPHQYKIELTTENNICFLYICLIDENSLDDIAKASNITLDYSTVSDWLRHIFADDLVYELVLINKSQAKLNVFKMEKFKSYLIAVLPFERAPEQALQLNVSYRFQRMKARKQILSQYWQKMNEVVKKKNPNLFLSLASKQSKKVFK